VGDKLFLIDSLLNKVINYRKKHQFIERIVGNHIECELSGVSEKIAFPFLQWEIN